MHELCILITYPPCHGCHDPGLSISTHLEYDEPPKQTPAGGIFFCRDVRVLVIAGRNFVGMTRTDLSKDRADYHHQIGGGFEKKSGEIYVPGSKLLILIYFGDGHPTFKDGNPFNANLLRHFFATSIVRRIAC